MAQANKTTKLETKMVEETIETPMIELLMTVDEASTLQAILWRVGGYDGPGGNRDCVSGISKALSDAGVVKFNTNIVESQMTLSSMDYTPDTSSW